MISRSSSRTFWNYIAPETCWCWHRGVEVRLIEEKQWKDFPVVCHSRQRERKSPLAWQISEWWKMFVLGNCIRKKWEPFVPWNMDEEKGKKNNNEEKWNESYFARDSPWGLNPSSPPLTPLSKYIIMYKIYYLPQLPRNNKEKPDTDTTVLPLTEKGLNNLRK